MASEKYIVDESVVEFGEEEGLAYYSFGGYEREEEDEEWQRYVADCNEYNIGLDDCNDDDYYYYDDDAYIIKPRVLRAPNNNIPDDSNLEPSVILGKIKVVAPSKKAKTFKYNQKDTKIFCPTLMDRPQNKTFKPCQNKKCNYVHQFDDIQFCNSECGRIVCENNYYSGKCFKRHSDETLDNYLMRKNIRIKDKKTMSFNFYEQPSVEFLAEFIENAKNLKLTSFDMNIVTRKLTLDEFYETIKSGDDEEGEGYTSEDCEW